MGDRSLRWRCPPPSWALLAAVLASLVPLLLGAQQFGAQVAIENGDVLVSEPVNIDAPATVRRYGLVDGAWEQVGLLRAPPHEYATDYFGRVLGLDDRSLMVSGTAFQDGVGAIWAYRRGNEGWTFDRVLQPSPLPEGGAFGRAGQLYGNLFFVSSVAFGGGVGAVWVFERDASGGWLERGRIDPEGAAPDERFGWSVAYDGERLLVGALGGEALRGAAYVFTRAGDGTWIQEARLALPDDVARPGDAGASTSGVSPSATMAVGWFRGTALLGLPGRNDGAGAVYTFVRQPVGGAWVRDLTLTAFDPASGAAFGHAFHTVDGELWISSPGNAFSGSIYRFAYDASRDAFLGATKLRNTIDPDMGDGFGWVVAREGDLAAIGQPTDDGGLGSVIVMRNRGGEWASEAKLMVPGPPGLAPIAGGALECGPEDTADAFNCSGVDLLSFLPISSLGGGRLTMVNDVWGWTDPESEREYAIVGRTDGVAFVDVTDPVSPRYVGSLPKTPGSRSNMWRDVKAIGNYAVVVADAGGRHGMQVFDLTRLRGVEGTPAIFEADAVYDGITSAHNVAVNEETRIAYVVGANGGGETCGGGLHMVDMSEPVAPTFAGCFQHPGTGENGTGYTHDAMCVIYRGPDLEHEGREICFGANETALSVADVTDKSSPVPLSVAAPPHPAYVHQGWLTEDHRYFFLDDELDEYYSMEGLAPPLAGARTMIWDVSDLDDPVLVKEHEGETLTIDHNLYIRGNLMYQANYESGLRILSVSDPENPVEVGFFDTVPESDSVEFNGSWSSYPFFESGTIVVTSMQEGVFFLRYDPREPLP